MSFMNNIWFNYHSSSQDRAKGHQPISPDRQNWPDSWKMINYKKYSRLPKIKLPELAEIGISLEEVLKKRESSQNFSGGPIPLSTISGLLAKAAGEVIRDKTRPYPSAGKRYPVEIYLFNFSGTEEWPEGIYHYNFKNHSLDVLWKKKFSKEEKSLMFGVPWANRGSAIIVLTGVFERMIQMFGERGYRYTLLEAGHLAQNLSLAACGSSLSHSIVGDTNDALLEELIDIDSESESVLETLILGA